MKQIMLLLLLVFALGCQASTSSTLELCGKVLTVENTAYFQSCTSENTLEINPTLQSQFLEIDHALLSEVSLLGTTIESFGELTDIANCDVCVLREEPPTGNSKTQVDAVSPQEGSFSCTGPKHSHMHIKHMIDDPHEGPIYSETWVVIEGSQTKYRTDSALAHETLSSFGIYDQELDRFTDLLTFSDLKIGDDFCSTHTDDQPYESIYQEQDEFIATYVLPFQHVNIYSEYSLPFTGKPSHYNGFDCTLMGITCVSQEYCMDIKSTLHGDPDVLEINLGGFDPSFVDPPQCPQGSCESLHKEARLLQSHGTYSCFSQNLLDIIGLKESGVGSKRVADKDPESEPYDPTEPYERENTEYGQ